MTYNEIKQMIIEDVIAKDTMSSSEAGYINEWRNFLSNGYTGPSEYEDEYNEILYDEFTDEELEVLWNNSHK